MSASGPFYRRVMADIRARIASGEWPPGSELPSTVKLVEMYATLFQEPKLSPGTVRHAVSLLIFAGELRGQQGKAVYVAEVGDGGTQD